MSAQIFTDLTEQPSTAMDAFESARVQYEMLCKLPREERKELLLQTMKQFEDLIEYEQTQNLLSENESSKDLNEDVIPYILASYYLGMLISNNIFEREKRAQAVRAALRNFNHFIDVLIQYKMYTRDELKLYGKDAEEPEEDSGAQKVTVGGAQDFQRGLGADLRTAEQRRELMRRESRCRDAAAAAQRAMETGAGERGDTYRALLEACKYQALREVGYLEEEAELLRFEAEDPAGAAAAAAQRPVNGKPKLVSLTPADVQRIVGHGKPVPLDTVELLRLEDAAKAAQAVREASATDFQTTNLQAHPTQLAGLATTLEEAKQRLELNQPIDFHKVDLEYGGGNPYTYQLPGETDDYRNYRYNVVRTDTFFPGQIKEPELDLDNQFKGEDDINKRFYYKPVERPDGVPDDEVEEDPDAVPEKRTWDDWKDENPTGYGNKPRLV